MGRRSYQPPRATSIGTPEAQLWASVLNVAMIEGFHGCTGGQYTTLAANSQAIQFLVADKGEWAASRRHICGSLGIDEEAFVARCKAVFEGGPPPDVPGFDSRRLTGGIERQRALYRALMTETPAPPTIRLIVQEPKPPRPPEPVEPLIPMHEAIFEAMSQRTSTPIEITEDGLLYWPIKAPDTGTFQRKPLPLPGTKQHRIMRVAMRKRGGNLQKFYGCGDEWEDMLRDVAAQYDLELVMIKDGLPVKEMTGETHLFLRLRP